MRWPFRRRDAPAPGPSAGAQEIAAPAAPPAWASLPPLQRTLDAPIELTAPSTAVLGDLSQRWSPAIALEPLGHELGSLAPAGTIGLSGPPIEGSRSGPELVGRPAQQRTAVQRMATATTASSQAPTDTTLPSGLPPSAPRFHAAVVEAPAPAVQRSLTSAADAVGAAAGEAAAEPGAMAPTEVAPSTSAALEPNSPSVVPVQREPTSAQATTAGRRLGLGAPLAGGRGGLPLQRAARVSATASVDSPVPADRPARVPVQRLALDQLPVGHPAAVSRASASPTDSAEPPVHRRLAENATQVR